MHQTLISHEAAGINDSSRKPTQEFVLIVQGFNWWKKVVKGNSEADLVTRLKLQELKNELVENEPSEKASGFIQTNQTIN